ncbi:MAG: hypothetical protein HYU66_28190 [Armatimonadetes bacterium]|nr:hypothetical protein [Armatimonadota bacterium]
MTEAEKARLRSDSEVMQRAMWERGSPHQVATAFVMSFFSLAGVLLALLVWAAAGRPGGLALWLLAGGVLGAAWSRLGLNRDMRRRWPHIEHWRRRLFADPDTAVETACSVAGAVVLQRRYSLQVFVLDVGDGQLLAIDSYMHGVDLENLGFPHERFVMSVAVGNEDWARLLSYRGEGTTVVPQRSMSHREIHGVLPYELPTLGAGKLFAGTLNTCLQDLKAAIAGDWGA